MYKYYLFNIEKDTKVLFKNNAYYLFDTLNRIYKTDLRNVNYNYLVLSDLVNEIPKLKMNTYLFDYYKNNDFYLKFKDKHVINNVLSRENSELILNNLFVKIISSIDDPSFLKTLNGTGDWFVRDFNNLNYFWLKNYCNSRDNLVQ